jgi:hypothetical protein
MSVPSSRFLALGAVPAVAVLVFTAGAVPASGAAGVTNRFDTAIQKEVEAVIDRSLSKASAGSDIKSYVTYEQATVLGEGVEVPAGSTIRIHRRGDSYTSVRDAIDGRLLMAGGKNKKQGGWASVALMGGELDSVAEERRRDLGLAPEAVVVSLDEYRTGYTTGRLSRLPSLMPRVSFGDFCSSSPEVDRQSAGTKVYSFNCGGDAERDDPCVYQGIRLTVKKSLIRESSYTASCSEGSSYSVKSTIKYSFKGKKAPAPKVSFGKFFQKQGIDRGKGWSKFTAALDRTNASLTKDDIEGISQRKKQVRNLRKPSKGKVYASVALKPAYRVLQEAGRVDVDVVKKSRGRTVLKISSAEPDRRLTNWHADSEGVARHLADVVSRLVIEVGKGGAINTLRTEYEPANGRIGYVETTFFSK